MSKGLQGFQKGHPQFGKHKGVYFSEKTKRKMSRAQKGKKYTEELWNINNGQTICRNCHKLIHKK